MSLERIVYRGIVGISALGCLGGGIGYVAAGERDECVGIEAPSDRIFCGLGQGSSEEAFGKIEHYAQMVEGFLLSFTNNPEHVPAAMAAMEFGLESHSNSALRVPEGMPALAKDLTIQQYYTMAEISFNDLKRYWTEFRGVNISAVRLEPVVPIGGAFGGCNGLRADQFAGLYCGATQSVAISENIRNGMPPDASSQQMHIYIRSVLSHEIGHAVQHFQNATEAGRAAIGQTMEEQATCLGGNAMAGDTPQIREYVGSYMASAAFRAGVDASSCGV